MENQNVRSIIFRDGEFIIRDMNHLGDGFTIEQLPGVLCQGVQYLDLRNVGSINHAGMASLIELLRSLLKNDIETRLVNANSEVRAKIDALGLENILKCE